MYKKNNKGVELVLFFFLFIQTVNAYDYSNTEYYVNLETYNLSENCKYGSKVYTFTITNKDNIFVNYRNVNNKSIVLSTELDTIYPYSAYAKNKSTIQFSVYEWDLKKIFEHDTLRIDYGNDIFDHDTNNMMQLLHIKEYTNLSIDKKDLKKHINNCKYSFDIYTQEEKERNIKRKKAQEEELKKKKVEERIKTDKVDLIWLH